MGEIKLIADAMKKRGYSVSTPGVWKWFNSQSIPDSQNILALATFSMFVLNGWNMALVALLLMGVVYRCSIMMRNQTIELKCLMCKLVRVAV